MTNKTPPSLPPRLKPTLSSSSSPLEHTLGLNQSSSHLDYERKSKSSANVTDHYAHLDKHLNEVRRKKKTNRLSQPDITNFQIKENDQVISIEWIKFLKSWIEYIISAAANDDVDRPLEPFSLNHIKHDVDRLYPMLAAFIEPLNIIRSVYRWENKPLTSMLAISYLILWYHDLILATIFFWLIVGIIWVRLDMFAEYGVSTLEKQPETEETVKSWNRNLWMKIKTRVRTNDSFDILSDVSITEWRDSIYVKHGPKLQLMLSDTVDYIERVKNLITWKRPARTRLLIGLMSVECFLLTTIPLRYTAKMFFLYFGFEFFVLQALRSHYPRHRRLFNIVNLLLWGVPNDAEYAIEVVRLSHKTEPNTDNENQTSADSKNNASDSNGSSNSVNLTNTANSSLKHRDHLGVVSTPVLKTKKSFSSISDISDTLFTAAERVSKLKGKDDGTIQETITSNVTSLALLATASAVNKVKDVVEKNKKKDDDKSNSEEEESNTFGCMYKGTIPGQIILQKAGFIFQTSRMTGSKVLVQCAYDDIIGVKKTKQYDVVFWHANGLEISLEDGTALNFEHVLRRDNCFNSLVSASNSEGSEWKKM